MTRRLTTGGAHDPFLPERLGAICQANAIDLAVSQIAAHLQARIDGRFIPARDGL